MQVFAHLDGSTLIRLVASNRHGRGGTLLVEKAGDEGSRLAALPPGATSETVAPTPAVARVARARMSFASRAKNTSGGFASHRRRRGFRLALACPGLLFTLGRGAAYLLT